MKELTGDIWDYYDKGNWVVITTNGFVKKNGEAVMGRGVAQQAKQRYPDLPKRLGDCLRALGNHVTLQPSCGLLTFPVKHNWWEKADLELIEQSCKELRDMASVLKPLIYLVRPGCSNGKRDWLTEVKPILEKYLDDRFVVVEKEG